MIFKTWKEFFKNDTFLSNARKALSSSDDRYITEEERYQHFKERMIEEVVAELETVHSSTGDMTYYSTQQIPLKNKQ